MDAMKSGNMLSRLQCELAIQDVDIQHQGWLVVKLFISWKETFIIFTLPLKSVATYSHTLNDVVIHRFVVSVWRVRRVPNLF